MEEPLRTARDIAEPLRVAPGSPVVLSRDFDPRATDGSIARKHADELLVQGTELLADHQARLFAEAARGVLLVLQGIDAAGKDSTIKHVMSGVNPQGVDVRSFKEPSAEELRHGMLWRYQRAVPERGRIGIFNRSHYEEVLVVRVHPMLLATEHVAVPLRPGSEDQDDLAGLWRRRYEQINDWERYLVDTGVNVVKVFLNLSKEEQARRFLKRIDRPDKRWKFSASDIEERRYWDDYQAAFDDMLSSTSTPWAPWYVVPADHKWFARLATAAILVRELAEIDPQYPVMAPLARQEMAKARAELEASLPPEDASPPPEA